MAAPSTTVDTHPLAQLTAGEISTARAVLTDAGLLTASRRVVHLGLEEPAEDAVRAIAAGRVSAERIVRTPALDVPPNRSTHCASRRHG